MALFNLKPSREIGILKEKVKEAILEGEIENNHEQAKNFVIQEAKKIRFIIIKSSSNLKNFIFLQQIKIQYSIQFFKQWINLSILLKNTRFTHI